MQQIVEQVSPGFLIPCADPDPAVLFEEDGNPGGRKRIGERLILLEGLFQAGQREARVDGQKCALRIGGRQGGILLSAGRWNLYPRTWMSLAASSQPVMRMVPFESAKAWSSRARCTIAVDQYQVLGLPSALVAVERRIASQNGQSTRRERSPG